MAEPAQPERSRTRRRAQHAAAPRAWPRRAVAVAAVVAIAAGLGILAHLYLFYHRSATVGSSLVHAEEHAAAAARAGGRCTTALPPSSAGGGTGVPSPGAALAAGSPVGVPSAGNPTVYAVLRAPTIALVAPVVDGVGDAQLDVAVGHVPGSSWPGASGTAVLAAHDVTWFSHVDQLRPGDQIEVETACQTFDYTVDDHRVVTAGTAIDQTAAPRLVLVTCYPLDALFLTSQRYLVEASLTRVVAAGERPGPVGTTVGPAVPAPLPLYAQGLGLATNPTPLGSLTLSGSPAPSWEESAAPLDDEGAVLALYFAALRSAGQDQPGWWADIAPGVPFGAAAPLVGSSIAANDIAVSPTLEVTGSTLEGASLTAEPVLSGGNAPGPERISLTAKVSHGRLVVTGWTMTPAG